MIQYPLSGSKAFIERIYPNPSLLNSCTGLTTYAKVIAHFTASSLAEDGIAITGASTRRT